MKLLVDAHIGRLIVNFLEGLGHDVLKASSFPPGTPDDQILALAVKEGRVVMTSDKDFGELVFRLSKPAFGIILLRIDVRTELERRDVVIKYWNQIESAVPGHFLVVTQTSVRKLPLPDPIP